jgi:hypothetical protein
VTAVDPLTPLYSHPVELHCPSRSRASSLSLGFTGSLSFYAVKTFSDHAGKLSCQVRPELPLAVHKARPRSSCTMHDDYFRALLVPRHRHRAHLCTAGLEQSHENSGEWTVHIWNRSTLLRQTTDCGNEGAALELLDAARHSSCFPDPPIYLHAQTTRSPPHQAAHDRMFAALERRFQGHRRAVCLTDAASLPSFVQAVEQLHLSPPPASPDGNPLLVQRWSGTRHFGGVEAGAATDRPRFLHLSTASALGLVKGAIPSVVDALLAEDCRVVHRNRLHRLLMQPPPHETALAVAAAVKCVASPACSSRQSANCRCPLWAAA